MKYLTVRVMACLDDPNKNLYLGYQFMIQVVNFMDDIDICLASQIGLNRPLNLRVVCLRYHSFR